MSSQLAVVVVAIILTFSYCEKAYPVHSINYVAAFRHEVMQKNIGCGEAVAYGAVLYPGGAFDAVWMLGNPYTHGINANCNRKDTYIKVFGLQQNYDQLIKASAQSVLAQVANAVGRLNVPKVIVDWKVPQDKSKIAQSQKWLEQFVGLLIQAKYIPYVQVPASLLCREVNGKKYILDISQIKNVIIKMYGEETGRYTTSKQIFGQGDKVVEQGYSSECSKFPSYTTLSSEFSDKQFYIGKTKHREEPGFIGAKFQKILSENGQVYTKPYFYDSVVIQEIGF